MKLLEQQLSELAYKYQRLDKRRKLEIEGYKLEIRNLKDKLQY